MTALNHTHNTRTLTHGALNTPAYRTTLKQKTLKYQSVKLYNEYLLPSNYHTISSINALKNTLFKRTLSAY
jgi:hypothetical protein